MGTYREISPPARLAQLVECFWVSEQSPQAGAVQRVVPDGCADILYLRNAAGASLSLVGPMTKFADSQQLPGSCVTGVRFRPALWTTLLRTSAQPTRDQVIALDDLCGADARLLKIKLDAAVCARSWIKALEDWLPTLAFHSPVQRAVAALEQSRGELSLEAVTKKAGLSDRHFRRLCLETTGLSPKLLARILRFRKASSLAPAMARRQAELAAECGYFDQAHLIADFRRFCGRTPGEMAKPGA